MKRTLVKLLGVLSFVLTSNVALAGAVKDTYTVDINSFNSIDLTANDTPAGSTVALLDTGGYTRNGANIDFTSGATPTTNIVYYYNSNQSGCGGYPWHPAADPVPLDACAVIVITVTLIADAPILTVNSAFTINEEATGNLGIATQVSDANGSETISSVVIANPVGATLTDGTNSSTATSVNVTTWTLGSITVQPPLNHETDFTLTVTSTAAVAIAAGQRTGDTTESTAKVINVTVTPVNDEAVITGSTAGAVTEDAGTTPTGNLNHTDVDAADADDAWTTQSGTSGTYGSFFVDSLGNWSYTLNNADTDTEALDAGDVVTDTFAVATTDGTSTNVIITITGANDAALFSGTAVGTVTEDAANNKATGDINHTDVDANDDDDKWTSQTNAAGTYGKLSIVPGGSWTYTLDNANPLTDALNNQVVFDIFSVSTAGGTSTNITITVNSTDDTASITGTTTGAVTEDAGGAPTADLDHTDTDNLDDAWTAQTNTAGTYGALSITAAGVWTYTLNNNDTDTDALDAGDTVTDTFLVSTTGNSTTNVVIEVAGANDAAVTSGSSAGAATEDSGTAATGDLSHTDVDGDDTNDAWTAQTSVVGTYGAFSIDAAGAWTYTIDDGNSATDQLDAVDSPTDTFPVATTGGTSLNVVITVNGVNDAAVTSGDSTGAATEDSGTAATGDLSHTDVDGDDANDAWTAQASVVGTYGAFSIDAAGAWTYTIDDGNSATDQLDAVDSPTDTFPVATTDGTSLNVVITVNGANDASVVGGTFTGIVAEGNIGDAAVTATGTVTISDVDGDDTPAFNDQTTLGAYGSFALVGGAWTYTLDQSSVQSLNAAESVTDVQSFSATDGASQSITITVNGAADVPVATADSYSLIEGASMTHSGGVAGSGVLGNDSDLDEDPLSVALIASTAFESVFTLNTDGSFNYTHDGSENFTDTFTYQVSDPAGNTSAVTTVTINITPVNDNTSVVADDAYSLDEGATIIRTGSLAGTGVLGNDTDADLPGDSLTVTVVSAPSFASDFSLGTNGSVNYTHDDSENFADSFTYEVGDGINTSSTATVTITINPVNDNVPVTVDDADGPTDEGVVLSVSASSGVLNNDSDTDGNPITASVVSGPSYAAAFTLNADGSYSYTHDDSENFTDTFTYQISDGTLTSTPPATVTITITPLDDNTPVVSGDIFGAVTEGNVGDAAETDSGVVAISDVDIQDTPSFSDQTVTGTYGSISMVASTWTYTLEQSSVQDFDQGDLVQDVLRLTATDGTNQDITISITGTNDSPLLAGGSASVNENSVQDTLVLALVDPDVDADEVLVWEIIAGLNSPEEFKIDSDGQILVGDHTPDIELINFEFTPLYNLTVQVTDAQGVVDTANVAITINNLDDAPGNTVCEEFQDGVSLDVLPVGLQPLKDFYNFTEADPCHRVVSTVDTYYMEEDKILRAISTDPAPADTATVNYAPSLENIPKDWDQDSSNLYYTTRTPTTASPFLGSVNFINAVDTEVDTGEFRYEPADGTNVTDNGLDFFVYRVCDVDDDESEARCAFGIVYISIEEAAEAIVNTDNILANAEDLAQGPLELPVPAIPNVFVLLDDSAAMASDILTDQSEGYYQVGSQTKTWFLPEDGSGRTEYAQSEVGDPGKGLWRLRNYNFNKVYYNPTVTYLPWAGLNGSGSEFASSPPNAAPSNPYNANRSLINLTTNQSMPSSDTVYIPHYYSWVDIDDAACPGNVVGVVDGDSPVTSPGGACTEGTLVEIRSGVTYPKGAARTDCLGAVCTYDEEIQNFANFYTYSRTRHFSSKTALGYVIADANNMRIGFGAFGGASDNIAIAEMNESPLTGAKGELLDRIYRNDASSNSTPIRDSLEQTGRYYECLSSRTIIRSGACPILPAPEGNCQQNFALVVTAGFWNASGPSGDIANNDGDGVGTTDKDWDGGVYADTANQTLADVAMYFYERDLSPLDDEVPANTRDLAGAAATNFGGSANAPTMHQHMSTFVIAFGVEGTVGIDDVPSYTTAFDWGDALTDDEKLNDLVHTAVNGRGDYLNADNPAELSVALENAFSEFAQAIGTASAVSFNSQEIQEGSLVYRAFYNIRANTGSLVAQSFDSSGTLGEIVWNGAQNIDTKIVCNDDRTFCTDTRNIISYDPTVADGAGGIPFLAANLTNAQQLALEDDPGNLIADFSPLFDAQIEKHVSYLRGDASNERPRGNLRERPDIEGRLGDIVNSTPVFYGNPNRSRRNSPPYPQVETYEAFQGATSRRAMVYVGANDGMVHGFDAVDGEEVFAYMPNNVITGDYSQQVKQLLSADYAHRYVVDLSIAVNDIYADVDRRAGDTEDRDWATVLIGGYRAGGKGYFALDITDPDVITQDLAANVVMWEFTDKDDTLTLDADDNVVLDSAGLPVSDLGYSFSTPTIAMSNYSKGSAEDNNDNEWAAVFGNGYNSTSGKAVLYVLFVGEGTDGTWCRPDISGCVGTDYDYIKIETPAVSGAVANGLGTPRGIDIDGNGTIDVAYAGDRFGNLYRFDLRDPDPSNWDFTTVFSANYTNPVTFALEAQPITNQPLVVVHPTEDTGVNCSAYDESETLVDSLCGGYIVIFGTGSYFFEGDGVSQDIQSVYGIWDKLGSTLVTKSNLVQQEYTQVTNDAQAGTVRTLSANPVDYTDSKLGWYINYDYSAPGFTDPLFPGEKAIRNFQTRGGIVFVNSVISKPELSCTTEAGGAANAFCAATGSLSCILEDGVFDVNNDGLVDENDLTTDGGVAASTFFEDSVPTDATFIGGDRVTQLSDQSLEIRFTETSGGSNTGRISWKRVTNE
ncbi:MAG: type IV pilus assembly protein PilY1 [Candidatus Azotimanducaceae bacterium]|jgi:type IV pilus assembly protein PilY1